MRTVKKGSMTIFLALLMGTFLSVFLILIEGTRIFFLRVEAAQAMELAEFSVLSEFQRELFCEYGIFAVDLDYEQGNERTDILKQRIQKYVSANMEEAVSENIEVHNFRRLTDQGGIPFFEQAVEEPSPKEEVSETTSETIEEPAEEPVEEPKKTTRRKRRGRRGRKNTNQEDTAENNSTETNTETDKDEKTEDTDSNSEEESSTE